MPHKKYDDRKKLEIVKEAYAEGADKHAIAKKYGITLSTLYGWKSDFGGNSKPKLASNGNGKPQLTSREAFIAAVQDEKDRLQARIVALDSILEQYGSQM